MISGKSKETGKIGTGWSTWAPGLYVP